MAEEQYLYLTTTGWKSGNPHEIEIWYVAHQQAYYIVAEKRENSHWIQNIQHDSAIRFRVGEQTFTGNGRIINPQTDSDLIKSVSVKMNEKYGWSNGLVVELNPQF